MNKDELNDLFVCPHCGNSIAGKMPQLLLLKKYIKSIQSDISTALQKIERLDKKFKEL